MKSMQLVLKEKKDYREIKNIILFSSGKIVSVFGSSIYTFALGLYVLKITGSALSFATTLILGLVPMIIIIPFAGVIADKFDKKKLVISMDLLNGVLLIGVYLLSIPFGLKLIMIYITTFLLTVFNTFFGVGLETSKPNIVSEKMLLSINSISKIIDSISQILGPMLGGLIFAVLDIRTFVFINGLSFVLSAVSECFIDFKFNTKPEAQAALERKINFIKDIKNGFQYMVKRKDIISLFIVFISLNFFLGFSITVPLPYIVNNVLQLGAKEFGIIEGAFPVGMVIGALLVKKISDKISYSLMLRKISFVLSLTMIMIGIPIVFTSLPFVNIVYVIYYSLVAVIFGIAIALIDIPISYLLQSIIPDEYRGRVMSIGVSMAKVMLPVALLGSGMLLSIIPAYVMPITGGVLFLAINVISVSNQNF